MSATLDCWRYPGVTTRPSTASTEHAPPPATHPASTRLPLSHVRLTCLRLIFFSGGPARGRTVQSAASVRGCGARREGNGGCAAGRLLRGECGRGQKSVGGPRQGVAGWRGAGRVRGGRRDGCPSMHASIRLQLTPAWSAPRPGWSWWRSAPWQRPRGSSCAWQSPARQPWTAGEREREREREAVAGVSGGAARVATGWMRR